tara:strand:- start:4673 stop:8383 length:3711 start_codon:yes stop_codon:yes gene_type:complete
MKPQTKDIVVPFPVGGLDQSQSHVGQIEMTTVDCKNVIAWDSMENRARGGRRPGIVQVTGPGLGGKIQLIDTIVPPADSASIIGAAGPMIYETGPYIGSLAKVMQWLDHMNVPENTHVSYRPEQPVLRESTRKAPDVTSDSLWDDGSYNLASSSKSIPLLPNGGRVRTADGGVWVRRKFNDRDCITPCPPLPYSDPERPRGKDTTGMYRSEGHASGSGTTIGGNELDGKTRFHMFEPNVGIDAKDRVPVDNIFIGGGNGEIVGSDNALPTNKMAFSSAIFPYTEVDDLPFNSKKGNDWACSCSVRPAPWDHQKMAKVSGNSSYETPFVTQLYGTDSDYSFSSGGHHTKNLYRLWDTTDNHWETHNGSSIDNLLCSVTFWGKDNEGTIKQTNSKYYYGMVFRLKVNYSTTNEDVTVGSIPTSNEEDSSKGLFIGFITDGTLTPGAGQFTGDSYGVPSPDWHVAPRFVVATIESVDNEGASGGEDFFKAALGNIIDFDGTHQRSNIQVEHYDPYDDPDLAVWHDIEVKCLNGNLSILFQGESIKFGEQQPTVSETELDLNAYLGGTEDTDTSLDNTRASSGLIFGVHKELYTSVHWMHWYAGGGSSGNIRGNATGFPTGSHPVSFDGEISGTTELTLTSSNGGSDDRYHLYRRDAGQDSIVEGNSVVTVSYPCKLEHATGGYQNADGLSGQNAQEYKGYFSGHLESGVDTSGIGSSNIKGNDTDGTDDGSGMAWVRVKNCAQLMFGSDWGADWLRTWMEPAFADYKFEYIADLATIRNPITIAVADGKVRDSRDNKSFAGPGNHTTNTFNANRSVVTGTSFLDKYYFADGTRYYRYNPATRTVEDWYEKAKEEGKLITGEDEFLPDLPGGSNFETDGVTYSTELKPRLVTQYMGRLVLAGKADEPNNWWMSGTGNFWDWNTSVVDDMSGPIAGNSTNLAEIGDPIRAIFPLHSSSLAIGCRDSIYALTDDPSVETAQLIPVSLTVGIISPMAWCNAANKTLFFFAADGLYRLQPNEYNVDRSERVSIGRLDKEFSGLDLDKHQVRLMYDHTLFGVHIFLIPPTQETGETKHYFYDDRNDSFWPLHYPAVIGPSYAMYYSSPITGNRGVFMGGFDGHIRTFDSDATSDAGTDIDSYVWIGPIYADTVTETKLMRLASILDEQSSVIKYEVYVGDTVEAAKAGSPVITSEWNSGRNPWSYTRARGSFVFVKVYQSASATPWAFEQITATLAMAGQTRVRS